MKNREVATLIPLSAALSGGPMALAAEARRVPFGELADGTPIEAVLLENGNGIRARIMTLGATLQSLSVPDREGNPADVVLGYDAAAEYLEHPHYFGATVGRYANRIAGGRFSLDGREYALEVNDGMNHLHGGERGFDKVVWGLAAVESGSSAKAVFEYVSRDGEGGYPGRLNVRAIYTLNDADELAVAYEATTDRSTIVNITNHSYFNLAGPGGSTGVMAHLLTIDADRYTPVDETLIPTGEIRDVAGTPFDFRRPRAIGERIRDGGNQQLRFGRGYDHNYVLNGGAGELRFAARVEEPASGRVMEVLSDAPGMQFYSGNFLDGTIVGKGGRAYRQGQALCLEPQVFPDSPNRPEFPSARLDPGETYTNRMIFRFSTTGS